ncbi:UNVERIFIED_CONTAM: Retrovirus-related Pol polyprotein from transposon TNT 1-94 [Sesamum latifolium]|uniref:Retrovirus-related Pol polyprotein from transposon TNT 1-94 n=1 Tax=Sesamum latifolium TaxID=2727402 RepID=A0AAW2VEF0_9LAMI
MVPPLDNTNSSPSLPTTRPLRQKRPPAWMTDFHCHSTSALHPASCTLASSYTDLMAALSTVYEPNHYLQAKGTLEWENAMNDELAALEKNHTWDIVDLPKGKKAIGSKWVYKVKLKPDASIDRYKARLVAKGYKLRGSITLTGSHLLPRRSRVHILLAVACNFDWTLTQVDINNAFLHGFLEEDIYMLPPDGSSIQLGKHKYIRDIIQDVNLASCTPANTPLPLGIKFSTQDSSLLDDPGPYRHSSLISWKSKKQSTVARSTAEAEYRSLGTTVCELQWISYLLHDLHIDHPTPIPAHYDNQAAIHIVANPVFHERTKHIEIDCHLVRDKYKSGFILPTYISNCPDTSTSVPAAPPAHMVPPLDNTNSSHSLPTTRPLRQKRPPAWMTDFHCHSTSALHPASCTLASSYTDLMAALYTIYEPNHYLQAKGRLEWKNAMNDELAALEKNHTWDIVDLPKGKKAISSKFSHVAKAITVCILLAVACNFDWALHQVDINNAFLHDFLEEDIYMLPRHGSSIQLGKVYKLKRSLYGRKQASRQWNQELTSKLLGYDFFQLPQEHCLFIKKSDVNILILLVYVDDVLIIGSSEQQIVEVKNFLNATFTIKDLGLAKFFLGLEIIHCSAGISVTQHKYIRDIIQDVNIASCTPANTPLPLGIKFSTQDSSLLDDLGPYSRLLSKFVNQLGQIHMDAALHLVRYLKGTSYQGLFFPRSDSFSLEAFCDADWVGCPDSRRSLPGYCVYLGQSLISWKSKKQSTVAQSTAEANYCSFGTTVCELQWISCLLHDLHINHPTPIPVHYDNQAAIHIVANPVFHERIKHIEIDCHLVRDKYKSGFILPTYISTKGEIEWENAMNDELASLEKNHTWDIVDLPKGQKAIGRKWVYKVKLKPDGSIDRYKARLVVEGYNQVEGVDYFDRFSHVAKAVTLCDLQRRQSIADTTICELQWISYLLHDLHIDHPTPIPVQCDNQAAIHIVANPVFHERTKYIKIDCHLVRDKYKSWFILPTYISSKAQLADLFTKSLSASIFRPLLFTLGLVSPPQVQLEGGMLSLQHPSSSSSNISTYSTSNHSPGNLHIDHPTPIPIHCDNQAAIHIIANPVFHEQTKNIKIDCHLVRDKYKSGFILPTYISSKA